MTITRIITSRRGGVTHTMHATGRLTEQAAWQWTGKQNARTKMQQAGVMANSQALIPLIGITPHSFIPLLMHILIQII